MLARNLGDFESNLCQALAEDRAFNAFAMLKLGLYIKDSTPLSLKCHKNANFFTNSLDKP